MANLRTDRPLDFDAYLVQTPPTHSATSTSFAAANPRQQDPTLAAPPTPHTQLDPSSHPRSSTQPNPMSPPDPTLHSTDSTSFAVSPGTMLESTANLLGSDINGSLGWDPSLFSTSDLSFQLPSFLGPSSLAAPGGGVEAYPTRSADDWNSPSFTPNEEMQFTEDGILHSGTGLLASGLNRNNHGEDAMWGQPHPDSYSFSAAIPSDSRQEYSYPHVPSTTADELSCPTNTIHTFPPTPQKSVVLPGQPNEVPTYAAPTSHLLPSGPTEASIPQIGKNMPGLYSSSGFDVLGVLSKVVSRSNSRTALGPVDFSCSFLVVDVMKYDHPIVYSSPTFSALTGYENKEIVGRNCRFLQGPDGVVERGSRRRYTDNVAISHLKRNLSSGKECQASLINYRKGGVPFINLVTVIPIPWDTDEIRFHVGFQVDLVESPNAILRNLRDGTYQVNYAVLNHPQLPLAPAGQLEYQPRRVYGLSPELLDVVKARRPQALKEAQENGGEDAALIEWYKTMFDHSDDFIHVLSLKGQFQYCSSSVRRILEYEPSELVNKFIGDICHPSDLVPVMRELKDSTHTPPSGESVRPVNFSFRVQKKNSGMVWMECTGRLHVEPGKGRKAVILCGRERAIPTLQWASVSLAGGVGRDDSWCMLSFEGLIIYASNKMKEVFSSTDDELVGSSIFDYIPERSNSASSSSAGSPGVYEPSHQRIRNALKLSSKGLPLQGKSTSVRHLVALPSGTSAADAIVEVETVFYAVDKSESGFAWSPMEGTQGPGTASPAESDQTDSFPVEPRTGSSKRTIRPASIVCQIKLVDSSDATSARQPIRASSIDVFEELSPTRTTGWHYELHQLKNDNRRLKEQVDSLKAARFRPAQDLSSFAFKKPVGGLHKRKRASGNLSSSVESSPLPTGEMEASSSSSHPAQDVAPPHPKAWPSMAPTDSYLYPSSFRNTHPSYPPRSFEPPHVPQEAASSQAMSYEQRARYAQQQQQHHLNSYQQPRAAFPPPYPLAQSTLNRYL